MAGANPRRIPFVLGVEPWEAPRNPLMRLLFQIKHRRQNAMLTASMQTRNRFVGGDGRPNLARLLAAAPFPVYGLLRRRPMGLRLKSPGWGGKGSPSIIDRASFGYVAGHPSRPEKAVDIKQGFNVEHDYDDLNAIKSLVHNNVSEERQESYFHQGNFHRDWNQERLQKTPRQQANIQVGDTNVEVQFTSWNEPQRVILARLTMEDHPILVASLNASWAELQEALTTLVVLQEDQEALAGHQQDRDEVSRQLREYP